MIKYFVGKRAKNKKWPEDSWKFKDILTVGRVSYEIKI